MPLPTIPSGNVASATAGAYEVANSCRFNSGDSPTLHYTPDASDVDKWTFSIWFKKSTVGTSAVQDFLSCIDGSGNNTVMNYVASPSNDTLNWTEYQGSYLGQYVANAKHRDPSAWYHAIFTWDSDNATAGNRMRIYINGAELTSFSTETNVSQDQDSLLNSNLRVDIGSAGGSSSFFHGYFAEVIFIDGSALTPSSFGEFNSDSPTIWQPKDPSGLTFGDNGFWLDFEDSSALGNDVSGNNNDLTVVNLAATDQCTDSPTNNFATMNPLWNFANDATLSEGNCKVVGGGAWNSAGATVGLTAGKWYYEVKMTVLPGGGSNGRTGFFDSEVTQGASHIFQQTDGTSYYYNEDGGEMLTDNSATTADYGVVAQGSILGVALNMDDKQVTFYDDNSAIITNYALSSNIETAIPSSSCYNETQEYNFGNPPYSLTSAANDENGYGNFEFAPPSGYLAICTKNLGSDGG